MYHEIPGASAATGASGYFAVPRTAFAAHLDALRRQALSAASLERVIEEPAQPLAAVTFDDGHISNYAEAFPELAERGMTATFFVITGLVGTGNYASWDQLREMSAAGMSIQSHTHTHPFLGELSQDQAGDELRRSKGMIEDAIGRPVTTLALPHGDAPRGWRADAFAASGYRWVATSVWGPNRLSPARGTFVRRYTVRRSTQTAEVLRFGGGADSAYSREGLRLRALSWLRGAMGQTRYARLRRRWLDRGR